MRAGIVNGSQASAFRWSSLPKFLKEQRPEHLHANPWLEHLGFSDCSAGWTGYKGLLAELADDPSAPEMEVGKLSQGWAIGTLGWRRAIARENAQRAISPGISSGEASELKAAVWHAELERALAALGKDLVQAPVETQSAKWKVQAARRLRFVGAPCTWIASALHMGSAANVRAYLYRESCSHVTP